jgi:N-methylhydantoinase A
VQRSDGVTGMAGVSLGIDIGGTFTDLLVHMDEGGAYFSHKELTTPDDPTRGVVTGLRTLFDRERLDFASVRRVVHATTLFTNALIERKGAPTGLVTTAGFRDVLEIGRERKYDLYDIFAELPQPLVARPRRLEVPERVAPDGGIEVALDLLALGEQVERLVATGVTSVAVVFLHSYANPGPEREARRFIEEKFPDISISISSDVAPQIREYERASTTVANAYIKPLAAHYLSGLADALTSLGVGSDLFLMLSNGGFTGVGEAKRNPIQMLESGPAAGALAGAYFGQRSKFDHVLAFDMGGTTAKLSVIDNAKPNVVHRFEAGRQKRFIEGSGLPLNISTVELIEIGAGGGSLAHIDELGLLKVGPLSAGSVPGPACYERGGTRPTVTDANLLLGYLDPVFFAGGTLKISTSAALAAVMELAVATGLDGTAIAWGIYDLVNETMAGAARVHVSEHGGDPRRYALLTTGGGGPLHGCEVARKLGITTVICPPSAGVASALGLLMAPVRIDRMLTVNLILEGLEVAKLDAQFTGITNDALGVVRETGVDPLQASCVRQADMRYLGQGFELTVDLPPGPYHPGTSGEIRSAFENASQKMYSRKLDRGEIEIVNIRVSVQAGLERPDIAVASVGHGSHALKGRRPLYFGALGGFVDAPIYDRAALETGSIVDGPALIEEAASTLLLPPGARACTEPSGNIVVTLGQPTEARLA